MSGRYTIMRTPSYAFEDDGPVDILLLCTDCSRTAETVHGAIPWWATWSADPEGISEDGFNVVRKARMLMEAHDADRHAGDDGA